MGLTLACAVGVASAMAAGGHARVEAGDARRSNETEAGRTDARPNVAGRAIDAPTEVDAPPSKAIGGQSLTPDGKIIFNRDIRPILSDNCYHCHGNDKNHIKAKLRMDIREVAIDREAIVPGKPDDSLAIARIFSDDPDDLMPPPDSHKKLTATQKELLKQWVAEGAEYQPHWAYIVPQRPATPAVEQADWAKNPIDAFVLARLEARGLTPSPEADRRTLLRRLSLDLIGLPPTPEDVEAFVKDDRPDAYERQVERLLASPHFGERMAVPWLDAVRFADTVGFHGDQNQNVFPYRDYVIGAFNSNKPFDQFTIEQIAGDLLESPTKEQLVATGFNRLNMMTREGGAQAKEYLIKYQADRVRTVGLAFLGSTFGCAECHDHKFDPISIKDFYSMSAFFADVRQWGVYADYRYTPNEDLKGYNNDYPFPPEIRVESQYLKARQARLENELAAARTAAAGQVDASAFEAWRDEVSAFAAEHPDGWATPKVTVAKKAVPAKKTKAAKKAAPAPEAPKEEVQNEVAGVQAGKEEPKPTVPADAPVVEKAKPQSPFITLDGAANELECVTQPGWVAAIRFEIAGDRKPAADGAKESTVRLTARVQAADGKSRPVNIGFADADFKSPRYDSTAEVIGVQTGWKLSADHSAERQTSVWFLDPPVKLAEGEKLLVSVAGAAPSPVRIGLSPLADWQASPKLHSSSLAAARGESKGSPADRQQLLREQFVTATAADVAAYAKLNGLAQQVRECRDGMAWTQVTAAVTPMTTRVLPRGNWQDESGEIVQPATPHFLPPLPGSEGRALNRLDLAKWIVCDQNPLTGRTVVNRIWKTFFGSGLCASIEDLGLQGEWPSHPELLDWLAVEFRDPKADDPAGQPHAWDVKHLVRLIVSSNIYRQQSNLRPALRDVDPANRLLSAQSPVRLEAEFVRDNALFASGLLNLDIGGPSVKPYQPEGYYAAIQFPDRPYNAETDERQYRRGLYTHWQRTFLHPMLANFDAPSREDSICTRVVSNTPQQALTLLNDPQFVEASRVMAAKLVKEGGTDAERIEKVYQRLVARSPKPAERESLLKFLAGQRQAYQDQPEQAKKLLGVGIAPAPTQDVSEIAAWANTCRVVMNLHESITRY